MESVMVRVRLTPGGFRGAGPGLAERLADNDRQIHLQITTLWSLASPFHPYEDKRE